MLRPHTIGFVAEYLCGWAIVLLALGHAISDGLAVALLLGSATLPWTVPWAIRRRGSDRRPPG